MHESLCVQFYTVCVYKNMYTTLVSPIPGPDRYLVVGGRLTRLVVSRDLNSTILFVLETNRKV